MLRKISAYLKSMDWIMLASVLLLVCFGLAEIYSVSLGRGGNDLVNFKKQIFLAIVGFVLMFVMAFSDYHLLRSFSNYFYITGVILLLAVLIFGKVINGTRGWFYIFGLGIQPVEFIKFALILFLARYFSSSSMKINPLRHFAITGGGMLVFFALIMRQPDFGSAMLLFAVWLSIIILTGPEKKYLISIFLVIAVIVGSGWTFYLKDYQKQRVLTFLNPSFDPLSQGYNVAQAIIAVGSGGVTGRGIGFGSQSQLKFLPESQTDFIFAVVSEEMGFFGVSLVMLFYSIFFYRCLASLRRVNNDFGIYFILGTMSLLFIEMFINIGMNIGLVPVVGIALPFISFGGSSLLINLMLVGVLQSIIIRSRVSY